MEFRFDLPDGYSRSDWEAFFRVLYRVYPGIRLRHTAVRLLSAVVGVFNFFLTVGLLVSEESRLSSAVLPAVLCLVTLAYAVGFRRLILWTSRKHTPGAQERMTITIADTGVTDQTGPVTTQYAYGAFTGIFYCRDVYLCCFCRENAPCFCRSGAAQAAAVRTSGGFWRKRPACRSGPSNNHKNLRFEE